MLSSMGSQKRQGNLLNCMGHATPGTCCFYTLRFHQVPVALIHTSQFHQVPIDFTHFHQVPVAFTDYKFAKCLLPLHIMLTQKASCLHKECVLTFFFLHGFMCPSNVIIVLHYSYLILYCSQRLSKYIAI